MGSNASWWDAGCNRIFRTKPTTKQDPSTEVPKETFFCCRWKVYKTLDSHKVPKLYHEIPTHHTTWNDAKRPRHDVKRQYVLTCLPTFGLNRSWVKTSKKVRPNERNKKRSDLENQEEIISQLTTMVPSHATIWCTATNEDNFCLAVLG